MISLENNPVIAAVRTHGDFRKAVASPVETVFLLSADILTLASEIGAALAAQKKIFVHIDLAEGLGKDAAGIAYLSKLGATGIISTRANLIRIAKDCRMQTVQRFFIVDSHSIETAIESVGTVHPDMIEVMPGVLPKVIARFCDGATYPVIAGGLIETKKEIIDALDAGASGISTAKEALWYE